MRAARVVVVSFISAVSANDVPLSATHAVEQIAALLQPHLHDRGASVSKLRKTMHGVHLSTQVAEDQATPGAADALNKALTGVITQIGEKVDIKIIQDHKATNIEIGRRVNNVVKKTTDAVGRFSEAKSLDQTWVTCVGSEKTKLSDAERATRLLQGAVATRNTECRAHAKTRNVKWDVETPSFECQVSDRCKQGGKSFSKQVAEIRSFLSSQAVDADDKYDKTLASCRAAKTAVTEADTANDQARSALEKQRSECEDLVEIRQTAMCLFGLKLQEKCGMLEKYKSLLGDVETVDGGVYSHPDRESQWSATHIVKCMLQNIISGTPLNSGSMNACAATVNFADSVGLMDYKKKDIESATTPDNFSCDEKEISFSGSGWTIPDAEDATSDGYMMTRLAYEVALTSNSAPFAFCNAEPAESCASFTCNRGKPRPGSTMCQGKCNAEECCRR